MTGKMGMRPESLAIVAYTKNPAKVAQYALEQEWFGEGEIIHL
jgi:hypothetical protein